MDRRRTSGEPRLVVVEEPQQNGQRFRYKCEGPSAGSILGVTSTVERKQYPAVQIQNYNGPGAIIVVSCVDKDDPYSSHPHSLVGQDCKSGVCTIRLKSGQTTAVLSNVGIQCCRRQDVGTNLESRERLRVDPFGTRYPQNNIDLSSVRLCFQAFLPDSNKRFTRIVQPVVSQQIIDKKSIHELIICRLSATSGSVTGGEEVFLLCEKVKKENIEVRFFEESEDGVVWEGFGEFTPQDVHKQHVIVFKTPPYRDQNIRAPVETFIQLRDQNGEEVGEPKPFLYRPKDADPDGIKRKKQKLNEKNSFMLPLSVLQHVKDETDTNLVPARPQKRVLKRTIAAAAGSLKVDPLPQYSYSNLGADMSSSPLVFAPPSLQNARLHLRSSVTQDTMMSSLQADAVPADMPPMDIITPTYSLEHSSMDNSLETLLKYLEPSSSEAQELSFAPLEPGSSEAQELSFFMQEDLLGQMMIQNQDFSSF